MPDSDPEVLLTGFGMEDAHSVANSLTFGPDGWLYGCQTEGKSDGYHWLRVRMGVPGDPCDTFVDLTPQLAAGAHTISFRNREPQYNSAAAAVSRVLVTTDLGFVPQ